jgi:hypothetical protein
MERYMRETGIACEDSEPSIGGQSRLLRLGK